MNIAKQKEDNLKKENKRLNTVIKMSANGMNIAKEKELKLQDQLSQQIE